ncbi:aminoacyl-tRNA hydrolase [Caenispirillum salinarum]|uniref:aminoacyl-tRNA hydrolase n=1 Tax=Caenispirillum salinarum TaxID=859058 RepID=UPI00384E3EA5
MRLVVGLGNPGAGYAKNRHNIGFMAADEIVRRHGFSAWKSKFQADYADGIIGGEKVMVLKPMTYMNLSGQSVGDACRFFKILPRDVIVLYDEIELAPGKIRVKQGGGHAGHNGLRSIDQHIGKDYWRVRLGIGRPPGKEQVAKYVLHDFSKTEEEWLTPLLEAVAKHMPLMVKGDEGRFMNKVTVDTQPPKPEKPPRPPAVTAETKQNTETGPQAAPATPAKADRKAEPQGALAQALAKAKAKLTGSSGGPDTES